MTRLGEESEECIRSECPRQENSPENVIVLSALILDGEDPSNVTIDAVLLTRCPFDAGVNPKGAGRRC